MRHSLPLALGTLVLGCGGATSEDDHAAGHPGAGGEHAHHGDHHDFSDVERFAALFDAPDRDAWQLPAEVVGLLELSEGMVVADLGAGTGYFEPHLSPAVGASGQVLALDPEEAMVAHMRQRFDTAGLTNVEARVIAADDPGLDAGSVDRILIVDTWHHIAERGAYARRLAGALRPGGFVLVVDFTEESPHGPPMAMRLAEHQVTSELVHGGLEVTTVEETLPFQYAIRAQRP